MTLADIATLRANTPPELELEAFVHGAMCMSVSGRCLLSHYLTGRDANRGACTQPCRWAWQMTEEHRPDRTFTVGETEEGSYILNADDLCTIEFLDKVCKAGIDSLKIEGRAKTFYYAASTTAAYRMALDAYLADPDHYTCPPAALEELTRTSHRRYSPGFYHGPEGAIQNVERGGYLRSWEVVAVVEKWENGIAFCTQRGKFGVGDTLEVLLPGGKVFAFTASDLRNETGELIESTPHAMMRFSVPILAETPPFSIIRRKIPDVDMP
jgi:putative protease